MAHITEKDYTKLADAIADDLITQNIPLNTSVQKLARDMGMSHEQIRRLCESTNNSTFNRMFQSKDKTASDRIIEFDVADADAVLGGSIKEASYTAERDNLVYLSEYRSLSDDGEDEDDDSTVKTAADEADYEPPVRHEVDVRTVKKTLDHLRHEKLAAAMAYDDTVINLRNRFKRLYQDVSFESFEKNAAAIHGDASLRPLTDLRKQLRLPEMEYDYTQLAKTAGYVDDSLFEFKLFADAVSQRERLDKITDGIARLEALR